MNRMGVQREKRIPLFFILFLGLALLVVFSGPLTAQEGNREELRRAEQKVRTLLREARELEEAGRLEKAEACRQQARALTAKIEESRAKLERDGRGESDELGEIMDGLERGVVALEKLGCRYEVEMLQRVMQEVRRKREEKREQRNEARERERGRNEEYEAGKRQIEIMKTAVHALMEKEKIDAADILKKAVQARVVRLERMKGEEAQAILKNEPKPEVQVRVLRLAAELWQEFGNREKAEAVRGLAERMQQRLDRRGRSAEARERPAPERRTDQPVVRDREERRDRRPEADAREVPNYVRRLERRIAELEKKVQTLQATVRRLNQKK